MMLAISSVSNITVDMDIFTPESRHFAFFTPWAHLNALEGVRQLWYAGREMKDSSSARAPSSRRRTAKERLFIFFPMENGKSQYVLYEDDGETAAYLDGAIASTVIRMNASEEEVTLVISSAEGSYAGMAESRLWRIRLHDQRKLSVHLENKNDRWMQESHTGFAYL